MISHRKYRKPARDTSWSRRFNCLNSNEQVRLRKIKKFINLFIRNHEHCRSSRNSYGEAKSLKAIHFLTGYYLFIKYDDSGKLERPFRLAWVVENLTPSFCDGFLSFQKKELGRLLLLFQWPEQISFDNKSTMSTEEVLIRGLYELTLGCKKAVVADRFGRSISDQSRAFTYFIKAIYARFLYLVNNNLEWWATRGHLQRSAELIGFKMALPLANIYALFIDCNCLTTSRPGGGPAEAGANAARWDPLLQQAYYNGWKSVHGLKHQTVDCAYGLTVDMYGPTSLRRNDVVLLRDSRINDRLREQCAAMGETFLYIRRQRL